MNIAFVDQLNQYNLIETLKKIHHENAIGMKIVVCNSVKELLMQSVQMQIDIAIVSEYAECEDIDGYDAAYHLKMINHKTLPIIIASGTKIDVRAGRSELFGYIEPAQIAEELRKLVTYAIKRLPQQQEKIICYRWHGLSKEAKLQDIIYFCSNHRVINFKCANGTQGEFYQKLDEVEKILEEQGINWLRASKSFLVNPNYIVSKAGHEITLYNGEILTISKKYQN